jgi:hypothetical protein
MYEKRREIFVAAFSGSRGFNECGTVTNLKGLSHEMDFNNVDEN